MPPLLRDLHSWVNQADFHVALVDGDEVIGFGARMRHRAHPQRDLGAVYATERADIEGLYNVVRGKRPVKVRVPADDYDGVAIATAKGLTERIRSATYRVPAHVFTGEFGYEVTPVFDATREFLDAIGVLYADTHRWDPPAPYTRRYIRQTMVNGAQHMAFVRDENDQPIGVAAALASDDHGVAADIALAGPLDHAHPDADAITRSLLAHLASFYALGDAPLWFEIDSGEGTNVALADIVTPHAPAEDEVVILTSD
ncbi:MAG: hypothetical protein QOG90_2555 [Actinomycetota bacterium]|jgi:hypothetical protein